jgi:hypothetical protein
MIRKIIMGAAAAIVLLLLLTSGTDPRAILFIVALAAGAYALFFMGDNVPVPPSAPPTEAPPVTEPAPVVDEPPPELEPVAEITTADRYVPPEPKPLPAWHAPLQSLLERIAPYCSEAIKIICQKTFDPNPLLTAEQTRLAGLINSATLRHGILIEKTILECLKDREDLIVWCEPHFRLSHGDTNYHKAATIEGAALASLPYGDGDAQHRTVQVDLIVFDRSSGVIRAYEIKRKNEDNISAQNLQIVRSLLMSYAETVRQLKPTRAEAWTISYYGEPSHKGGTWRLTRADLNEHFGCPIRESVDSATATYRADLQAILTAPLENAA